MRNIFSLCYRRPLNFVFFLLNCSFCVEKSNTKNTHGESPGIQFIVVPCLFLCPFRDFLVHAHDLVLHLLKIPTSVLINIVTSYISINKKGTSNKNILTVKKLEIFVYKPRAASFFLALALGVSSISNVSNGRESGKM